MASYKKDQGRVARVAVFWTLAALVFWGCKSLRDELSGLSKALAQPLISSQPKIPVLGVVLNASFLIAATAFGVSIWLLLRWLEKPKSADLLIETETELRKVTWPTAKEVINASLVVIFSVLFLMVYLAGSDYVLARVAKVVLFGNS